MQVAVAVSGIEGFYWNCDQEFALAFVAYALTPRGVTYPIDLMQGMRHVISECRLFKRPLAVGCRKGCKRKIARRSEILFFTVITT